MGMPCEYDSQCGNIDPNKMAIATDRLKDEVDAEAFEMLKKTAAGNTIFLRAGDGFEALPLEAGGVNASWAWAPILCDFDLDGRTDIFVTNGFVTGELAHDT